MRYYEVAPTRVIRLDSSIFTYSYSSALVRGNIVLIEVGHRQIVGIIMREVEKPSFGTKMILSLIEPTPLPGPLLELTKWISSYYVTHLGIVLQTLIPRGVQKSRRYREATTLIPMRNRTKIILNKDQSSSLAEIESSSMGTVLLHGITGSGKTAVYIEAAKHVVASGQSVIILVPEIALTTQLVDEFMAHFDNVTLTHSQQTEADRHTTWKSVLSDKGPRIVIGPRSALFLPLHDIGLIVIDEAHEPSFKQEQSPRYSALRAASVLAKWHGTRVILGSATPSVADYFIAKQNHRPIIEMASTARPSKPPVVSLINMTDRTQFSRHRFLSNELLNQLELALNNGHQALIFHNRRGSASTTLCDSCGWQAMCQKCFVPLILHTDSHELRCHICGRSESVPTNCPVCNSPSILHKGVGTKLVESELSKMFPDAKIGRFDGDSDISETLNRRYGELYSGSINLIVGTQVVAKGLDLPKLRMVGVIQADAGLALPDYAASERTFQLLAQVVGRVGRSDHDTAVVVQSYRPDHPAIIDGVSQNYSAFYDKAIVERRRAHFPPFSFLLKLTCTYKTEAAAIRNAQNALQIFRRNLPPQVEVLGPTPAFYERRQGTYRWQLVLKSTKRALLVDALKHLPASHWQFELDPTSLL